MARSIVQTFPSTANKGSKNPEVLFLFFRCKTDWAFLKLKLSCPFDPYIFFYFS